jgi:pentatricopeptide repeat protein
MVFQDSVTYNAVLAALRRAMQWQGALEVLQH